MFVLFIRWLCVLYFYPSKSETPRRRTPVIFYTNIQKMCPFNIIIWNIQIYRMVKKCFKPSFNENVNLKNIAAIYLLKNNEHQIYVFHVLLLLLLLHIWMEVKKQNRISKCVFNENSYTHYVLHSIISRYLFILCIFLYIIHRLNYIVHRIKKWRHINLPTHNEYLQ